MTTRTGVDAFKLPFTLDPVRLAHDAERLERLGRAPQPGPHHDGEWTGVAIHSAGGVQSTAPSFPSMHEYRFTAEADEAPYLREILTSLPCPLQVVRVLALPPGGKIHTHVDFDTNFQFGLVRLHIPLRTNPGVEFLIGGRRYDMRVGELWYGDFSRPHEVFNRGAGLRLHAVIDIELVDEILALMPADYVEEQAALGPVSTHRPSLARPGPLGAFECVFFVPGTVLPLLVMGNLVDLMRGVVARVRHTDGELTLLLGDRPHCRLVPVADGEFTLRGMPPGCFLLLSETNGQVTAAELIVRGVQEDLVAARVGVVRRGRIPERRIPLDLI